MITTITATLAATALSLGVAATATDAAPAHPVAGPPVIHESFTALKCSGSPSRRTTLQLEGCAEQKVLASDARIDATAKSIYQILPSAGRAQFVSASAAWLSYRNDLCRALASPTRGGSEAPVIVAQCLAKQNTAHLGDLRAFLNDLNPAG